MRESRFINKKERFFRLLPVALLLALAIFSGYAPEGRADGGGGFPTSTPTVTPTVLVIVVPTQTVQPTGQAGIFPPTNTPTSSVAGLTQEKSLDQQAIPMVDVAGEEPATDGFSIVSCWPLALVAILLALGGIYYLSIRIRRGSNVAP